MVPIFSCPMMTGLLVGGVLYNLTSVPQMPATSIFIKAASSGTSGIGYSRISVLLGPTLTAASTLSTTEKPPIDRCRGQCRAYSREVESARAAYSVLPSPLPGWGSCGDPLTDPHPQPLPTRGRGAHRVRGMIK